MLETSCSVLSSSAPRNNPNLSKPSSRLLGLDSGIGDEREGELGFLDCVLTPVSSNNTKFPLPSSPLLEIDSGIGDE